VTYPPPPGQPQMQQPAAPKKSTGKKVAGCGGIGCLGLIVVIIIAAAVGAGHKSSPKSSSSTAAPPSAAAPAKSAPARAPVAAKAKTVLVTSGNGMKSTQSFTVHGDWDLYYSYDCTSFGQAGNFTVNGNSAADLYVNTMAMKGKDVSHEHSGGKISLSVTSECDWKIKVVDIPG